MSKVKLCKTCRNKSIDGDLLDLGYFPFETDIKKCPFCHNEWEDSILEIEELDILLDISRSASFFDAMLDLKQKDIIEFNLKMSQFKTQLNQTKTTEQESTNQRKCKHCGSTQFTPVRKKWSILTGFMTNKTELICNNCGKKVD